MPTKFNVKTKELQAMTVFSSSGGRWPLSSIHCEIRKHKLPLLVSTDGRRLAALETQSQQYSVPEADSFFTISLGAVKTICGLDRQFGKKGGTIELTCDGLKLSASFADGRLVVEWTKDGMLDGNYPNWRKCLEHKNEDKNVSNICFSAEYVADFAKVASILKVPKGIHVNLFPNMQPLEIRLSQAPYFYALLMPMRGEEIAKWKPEFLSLPLPPAEPTPVQTPTEQPTEKAA